MLTIVSGAFETDTRARTHCRQIRMHQTSTPLRSETLVSPRASQSSRADSGMHFELSHRQRHKRKDRTTRPRASNVFHPNIRTSLFSSTRYLLCTHRALYCFLVKWKGLGGRGGWVRAAKRRAVSTIIAPRRQMFWHAALVTCPPPSNSRSRPRP